MSFYPSIDDEDFYNKLYLKQEFRENTQKFSPYVKNNYKDTGIYQEPYQQFMAKYLSPETPYDTMLFYWKTGAGKTLGVISVLERYLPFVNKRDFEKILIITKNDFLQDIFIDEIIKDPYNNFINEYEQQQILNGNLQLRNVVKKKIKTYYEFINYDAFANRVIGQTITSLLSKEKRREKKRDISIDNRIIVIDEAQNITGNMRYVALMKKLQESQNIKLILLSATPMTNSPDEIIYISNLLNYKQPYFPISSENIDISPDNVKISLKEYINNNYLYQVEKSSKDLLDFTDLGLSVLIKSLKGKVSYVPENTQSYPKILRQGEDLTEDVGTFKIVRCLMSDYQTEIYKKQEFYDTFMNKKTTEAATFVGEGNTLDEQVDDNVYKNTPLTVDKIQKYSSKIHQLLLNMKKSKGIIFIYSNYVKKNGTELIMEVLKANGYLPITNLSNIKPTGKNFLMFTVKLTPEDRQLYKNIINHPKNIKGDYVKIIIGSPLISEGISFLNTRQVHILEPAWKISVNIQAESRCVRAYSHHNLPLEERNVEIYWYASSAKDFETIDEIKYIRNELKDRLIKRIDRVIKSIAVDCYNNKQIKTFSQNYKDFSRDCDYTFCQYNCMFIDSKKLEQYVSNNLKNINNENLKLDASTYNNNSDPKQISLLKNRIKNLFNYGDNWRLIDFLELKDFEEFTEFNLYFALNQIIKNKEQIFVDNKGYGIIEYQNNIYNFKLIKPNKYISKENLNDFFNKYYPELHSETEKIEIPSYIPLKNKISSINLSIENETIKRKHQKQKQYKETKETQKKEKQEKPLTQKQLLRKQEIDARFSKTINNDIIKQSEIKKPTETQFNLFSSLPGPSNLSINNNLDALNALDELDELDALNSLNGQQLNQLTPNYNISKKTLSPTQSQIANSLEIDFNKREKIYNIFESINVPIFGYIDENVFKIVDYRNINIKKVKNKPTGRRCTTIDKNVLKDYFNHFNEELDLSNKKIDICKKLHSLLKNKNLIFKLT